MARVARIALDLTLSSIIVARPAIKKIWLATKSKLVDTKAKALVDNGVVTKIEDGLGRLTTGLVSSLEALRNRQLLPAEQRYLEHALDKVKKKIARDKNFNKPSPTSPAIYKLPGVQGMRGGRRRGRRRGGPWGGEENS